MGFEESNAGEDMAGFGELVMDGVVGVGADCAAWGCGGDFIDAVEAGDFLDEVDLAFEVGSPGRDGERGGFGWGLGCVDWAGFTGGGLQAEAGEEAIHFLGGQFEAEEGIGFFVAERDLFGGEGLGVGIDGALGESAAGELDDELGGAEAGVVGDADICTAFEAV